jgi:hypothetical protein
MDFKIGSSYKMLCSRCTVYVGGRRRLVFSHDMRFQRNKPPIRLRFFLAREHTVSKGRNPGSRRGYTSIREEDHILWYALVKTGSSVLDSPCRKWMMAPRLSIAPVRHDLSRSPRKEINYCRLSFPNVRLE